MADWRGRTPECLPFCQGGLHEEGCPVVAGRCREDYVYVGQSEGGPVHTFCETCPRRSESPSAESPEPSP